MASKKAKAQIGHELKVSVRASPALKIFDVGRSFALFLLSLLADISSECCQATPLTPVYSCS
jgi:hypothetical protein